MNELLALYARLANQPADRRRLVLAKLRADGWPVPLELRASADSVGTMPPLEPECYLAADIRPERPCTSFPSEPRGVLLTGATGFIGAFLLEVLLRRTRAKIYCLVRAPSAQAGRARIADNFTKLLEAEPEGFERVIAVAGDLTRRRFGLTEPAFDELAARTDLVLHSGALVNFLYGYDALIGPNVVGTQEILRLACRGTAKPVHFLSTLALFMIAAHPPERHLIPEGAGLELARGTALGYGQSKWVGEWMVEEARRRGLPVVIHRAGLVLSDSRTGIANANDLLYRSILAAVELGAAPATSGTIEVVPVDLLTRGIVALALTKECLGSVYHYLAPQPCPVVPLEALARAGLHPEVVSMETWLHRAAERRGGALEPLQSLFTTRWPGGESIGDFLANRPRIERAATTAALSRLGEDFPPTSEVLDRTLHRMLKSGAMQRTSSRPTS
jgi:myxalamid-type nonribosomal peptide synthetase MxaA